MTCHAKFHASRNLWRRNGGLQSVWYGAVSIPLTLNHVWVIGLDTVHVWGILNCVNKNVWPNLKWPILVIWWVTHTGHHPLPRSCGYTKHIGVICHYKSNYKPCKCREQCSAHAPAQVISCWVRALSKTGTFGCKVQPEGPELLGHCTALGPDWNNYTTVLPTTTLTSLSELRMEIA